MKTKGMRRKQVSWTPSKIFPSIFSFYSMDFDQAKKKNSLCIHKRAFIIETNSGMTIAGILFNLACAMYYALCIITVKLPPLAKFMCLVLFYYHYANSLLYYGLCANGWIPEANSTWWMRTPAEPAGAYSVNQQLLQLSSLRASRHCFRHAGSKQQWLKLFWVNTSWNSCYFRILNNEVVDIWYLV